MPVKAADLQAKSRVNGFALKGKGTLRRAFIFALLFAAFGLQLVSAGCAITPDGSGHVEIPASWTSIGYAAFDSCSSLTSVSFESGSQLTTIGEYAFNFSGLSGSITLPASLTSIGDYAFNQCSNLTSVNFNALILLETIGNSAFSYSGLTGSITLPASLTSIGNFAFYECSSSFSVSFESGSQLTTIDYAFVNSGLSGSITLPASLTNIGNRAFYESSSSFSVSFESGSQLTTIGWDAFKNSGLSGSITLPASLTSIGTSAFWDCSSLISASFRCGSSSLSIHSTAFGKRNPFDNSGVTSIAIPSTATYGGTSTTLMCTSVGASCSSNIDVCNTAGQFCDTAGVVYGGFTMNTCQLAQVGYFATGDDGTQIACSTGYSTSSTGAYAFADCDVCAIDYYSSDGSTDCTACAAGYSASSTGSTVCDGCAITPDGSGHVEIPASWTSIGYGAFSGCSSLTSVSFESGSQLTTIGDYAFKQSGLNGITLPASVTSIGSFAFSDCSSLTSVNFESGNQLTTIGTFAFSGVAIIECFCGGDLCPVDFANFLNQHGGLGVCNDDAACPVVGERYSVDKGMCLTCPIMNACVTGYSCEVGYEGDGCAQCSDDYFFLNDACRKCPGTNIVLLIGLGLLFTAIFGVGIYYLSAKLINFAGLSTISIGHFQTISVFMKINLPIPQLFYDIVNKIQAFFAFMYIDLFFSPECVTNFDFYEKWALLTFIPIILLVIVYIFEGCPLRPNRDCTPEFGRMLNIGVTIFYVYLLSQAWTMWDCQKLEDEDGSFILESNPSIVCFDSDADPRWGGYATLAFFLVIIFTYIPFELLDSLANEPNQSRDEKRQHREHLGFLYLKYKPEYYYWEPKVEMSRKWFVVFFSTFMPTSGWQAGMDIAITCVYWFIHAKHLPYRTDWKDSHGNPADPDLENNLQHFMYAIQISVIIGMLTYESYQDNPNAGAAVLLVIYFAGVAALGYCIIRIMIRQYHRKKEAVPTEDEGEMGTSVEMIKTVLDRTTE